MKTLAPRKIRRTRLVKNHPVKVFRIDGHLFRVKNRELQYFVPNFNATKGAELGEISGFWDSIVSFGSNAVSSIGTALKNISLPSMDTIMKAVDVAGGALAIKGSITQQKLIEKQIKNQIKNDNAQNQAAYIESQNSVINPSFMPGAAYPNPSFPPAGFSFGMDKQTMLLIGGAAVVLFIALRR